VDECRSQGKIAEPPVRLGPSHLGRQVEDVEADPARRVNVWMVNGRDKEHLWRLEWVSRRYHKTEPEPASRVRRAIRTLHFCAHERDASRSVMLWRQGTRLACF
jgi:hypothetical protein